MRLPSACVASAAAFISSYVKVCWPETSWPLPVEPNIFTQSAPAAICSRATRMAASGPSTVPGVGGRPVRVRVMCRP